MRVGYLPALTLVVLGISWTVYSAPVRGSNSHLGAIHDLLVNDHVRTTESDVLPRDGSNISDILGLQKRATAKVGNGQGGGKEKRIHFPPPSTVPAKSIKQTPKTSCSAKKPNKGKIHRRYDRDIIVYGITPNDQFQQLPNMYPVSLSTRFSTHGMGTEIWAVHGADDVIAKKYENPDYNMAWREIRNLRAVGLFRGVNGYAIDPNCPLPIIFMKKVSGRHLRETPAYQQLQHPSADPQLRTNWINHWRTQVFDLVEYHLRVNNVLHQDIKDDNVLWVPDPRDHTGFSLTPTLIDWERAWTLEELGMNNAQARDATAEGILSVG